MPQTGIESQIQKKYYSKTQQTRGKFCILNWTHKVSAWESSTNTSHIKYQGRNAPVSAKCESKPPTATQQYIRSFIHITRDKQRYVRNNSEVHHSIYVVHQPRV